MSKVYTTLLIKIGDSFVFNDFADPYYQGKVSSLKDFVDVNRSNSNNRRIYVAEITDDILAIDGNTYYGRNSNNGVKIKKEIGTDYFDWTFKSYIELYKKHVVSNTEKGKRVCLINSIPIVLDMLSSDDTEYVNNVYDEFRDEIIVFPLRAYSHDQGEKIVNYSGNYLRRDVQEVMKKLDIKLNSLTREFLTKPVKLRWGGLNNGFIELRCNILPYIKRDKEYDEIVKNLFINSKKSELTYGYSIKTTLNKYNDDEKIVLLTEILEKLNKYKSKEKATIMLKIVDLFEECMSDDLPKEFLESYKNYIVSTGKYIGIQKCYNLLTDDDKAKLDRNELTLYLSKAYSSERTTIIIDSIFKEESNEDDEIARAAIESAGSRNTFAVTWMYIATAKKEVLSKYAIPIASALLDSYIKGGYYHLRYKDINHVTANEENMKIVAEAFVQVLNTKRITVINNVLKAMRHKNCPLQNTPFTDQTILTKYPKISKAFFEITL